MINRVILVGRLTKDPELRYTPSGVAVTTFTIAVDKQFKNAQGEREADFISVVAWRQTAELCAQYLKKGSQTGVDGRLQSRSYDNKEGKRVYVTEVVAENVQFLSPAGERREGGGSGYSSPPASNQGRGYGGYDRSDDPFANESKTVDISDDDLPF
ncbi:single-stranded DNA-binding protein [Ammoniphilus sp. CFH 90114]|uniref:single-stranded DNA-binding protein n=1 Tax=Ammoniphilus sp. CFH 90114 TaxID=2493665 RepID=UPI00100ED45A|nr:single-stranded DNA-binding protein [Ammoniphilus sp. CFH 90114]RXT08881.1 single-stranded DNA-binding protein [Ammoniphilus sp. CFH 90114]